MLHGETLIQFERLRALLDSTKHDNYIILYDTTICGFFWNRIDMYAVLDIYNANRFTAYLIVAVKADGHLYINEACI